MATLDHVIRRVRCCDTLTSITLMTAMMTVMMAVVSASAEEHKPSRAGVALTSDVPASGVRSTGLSASTSSLSDLLYDSWLCDLDVVSENVVVSAPNDGDGRLLEVHVRSNVKGEVEIRDGKADDNRVHIEIQKINQSGSGRITVNRTMYDVGHGTIFVLQIDQTRRTRGRPTLVVGSTICGAVGLTVLSLVALWFYRRSRRRRAAGEGAGERGRGGASPTAIADTFPPAEIGEVYTRDSENLGIP